MFNVGGPLNTKLKSTVRLKWVKERKKESKKATFAQLNRTNNSSI
jgi:hypothetical protein